MQRRGGRQTHPRSLESHRAFAQLLGGPGKISQQKMAMTEDTQTPPGLCALRNHTSVTHTHTTNNSMISGHAL